MKTETAITKTDRSVDTQGTEIVRHRELTPAIWTMISQMAPVMHRSRMFGVTSAEAAAAVMLKGFELGLGITASFEFINIIQGKPSLSPRGALALLYEHPAMEAIRISRLTDEKGDFVGYECYMKRKNGLEHTASFTIADALKAGLVKPGSAWMNYPENMCMWRAVGFTADVVASDITAGMTAVMKMPEAYGVGISDTGEVIEAQWSDTPPATEPASTPPAESTNGHGKTLEELANIYGGEAILAANEGRIPATQEELDAVAAKLGA